VKKSRPLYILSPKNVRFSISDHASLNSAKSFTEAGVNIICSGCGNLFGFQKPKAWSFIP